MRFRWLLVAAVPPLVLAAVGLTHPGHLMVETAPWWTTMHMLLLPLFALLSISIWALLRLDRGVLGWLGRGLAVVYLVFYGALDAISGVAAGTVVQVTGATGTPQLDALFSVGTLFGRIGGWAVVAAGVVVIISTYRSGARGLLYLVGSLGVVGSSVVFALSHIYWPRGGLAMVGLAVGFALLEIARERGSKRRGA